MGRSTVPCGWPQLCAKQAKMSIPVLKEVPKQLMSSLPDASLGWTCHVPPHIFEMSTWNDFTPLCDCKVLLWCIHIPLHQHHTQSGFSGQHPPYTQSSHSGEGMARASLDQDEALEDDFCIMWREDNGCRSSPEGRLECSRGSLG